MKAEQAAMAAEEQDPGAVSRIEAQLAETVAVIPTLVVRIETYFGELEGVMATIEDAKADQMDEIRETEEWQKAAEAIEAGRAFNSQE